MRIIDIKFTEIRTQVTEMMLLVEKQIEDSFNVFTKPDITIARRVIRNENKIDKYEFKINKNCEKFLAICTPVADDLRNIMEINNMLPSLERISDITSKLAKYIKKYPEPLPDDFYTRIELSDMLFQLLFMYRTVHECYSENTTLKLQDVFTRDKEVNRINKKAKKYVIEIIDTSTISTEQLVNFLLILTQLERMGDYIKAIAEEIYFGVEGIFMRQNHS